MKIIYSAVFTITVIIGTLALANNDYEFGLLCLFIGLSPLVVQKLWQSTKTTKPIRAKKSAKAKKSTTKRRKKYDDNVVYATRYNRSNKTKKSNRSSNQNNNDFFDITDAWNSI